MSRHGFIPQRNAYDCGVAAAAMLLDLTYEEFAGRLKFVCGDPAPGDSGIIMGVSSFDVLFVALDLGIPATIVIPYEEFAEHGGEASLVSAWPLDRCWQWIWEKRKRAWLSVEAKRNRGARHSVYCDGTAIHDPVWSEQDVTKAHYHLSSPDFFEAVVRLD